MQMNQNKLKNRIWRAEVTYARNAATKKQKRIISGQLAPVLPDISTFRTGDLLQSAAPVADLPNSIRKAAPPQPVMFWIL
jgi:hypothetical protein